MGRCPAVARCDPLLSPLGGLRPRRAFASVGARPLGIQTRRVRYRSVLDDDLCCLKCSARSAWARQPQSLSGPQIRPLARSFGCGRTTNPSTCSTEGTTATRLRATRARSRESRAGWRDRRLPLRASIPLFLALWDVACFVGRWSAGMVLGNAFALFSNGLCERLWSGPGGAAWVRVEPQ